MSRKVIRLADWRKKRGAAGEVPLWLFDLRGFVSEHGYEGRIIEHSGDGEWTPEQMRQCADCLDELSWFLRQQAEEIAPTDDGVPLATVTVFESSRVRVRVNDKVHTHDHLSWLDDRFDDAKDAARILPE